jgi:hypothetical protein
MLEGLIGLNNKLRNREKTKDSLHVKSAEARTPISFSCKQEVLMSL